MTAVPDFAADLDGYLLGDEPDWDAPPEPPPDEDRANAMLARLARLEADEAREVALAARRVAEINDWVERRRFSRNQQVAWLRASLEGYMAGVYARRGIMSLSLPAGELSSRLAPAEWVFDEEAFLAWAERNLPAAVRRRPPPPPEIDRVEAKRLLTRRDPQGRARALGVAEDGSVPDGLTVIPGERRYYVTAHRQEGDE